MGLLVPGLAAAAAGEAFADAGAGRGYEQITPVEKGGGELLVEFQGFLKYLVRASPTGGSVGFAAQSAFSGNPSGLTVKSYSGRRGAYGWSVTADDYPARGAGADGIAVSAYSEDLSKALVSGRGAPIAAGAQPGVTNFYVRDLATGTYSTVTRDAPAAPPPIVELSFIGGSRDFSHVVFQDSNPHSPDAPPFTTNVYDWSTGAVRLVGVLPDGRVAPGGAVGGSAAPDVISGNRSRFNAVSRDGSRIFFSTPNDNQIYVRINGNETKAVSASQKAVPDPSPTGATFWGASGDGRTAVLTTYDQLLDSDTNSNADLYAYDTVTGRLKLETSGADVYQILGMAQDASYVYFMAIGDLVDGVSASDPNIYVWHDGTVRFVASWFGLSNGVMGDGQTARTSDDGTHFAFVSSERLTRVDTAGLEQVYLYDAVEGQLTCASCRPDGTPADAAASLPPGRQVAAPFEDPIAYQRSLSEDGGHLFFSTAQQLVDSDVNRAVDAYEYTDGRPRLLSAGRGSGNSYFLDASSDGHDAFFSTREQLVPADVDDSVDLYDAREGGGFPPPRVPSPPCSGDDCRVLGDGTPPLADPSSDGVVSGGNAPSASPSPQLTVLPLGRAALRNAAKTGKLRLRVRPSTAGTVEALAFARIDRRNAIVGHGAHSAKSGRVATLVVPLQAQATRTLVATGVLRLRLRVTQLTVERATVLHVVLRKKAHRGPPRGRQGRSAARHGRGAR